MKIKQNICPDCKTEILVTNHKKGYSSECDCSYEMTVYFEPNKKLKDILNKQEK